MTHPDPAFPSSAGRPAEPAGCTAVPNGVWPGIPPAGHPGGPPAAWPLPVAPRPNPAQARVEAHPLYRRVAECVGSLSAPRLGAGPKRTHILFVLDQSSSMQQGKAVTIGGYNDQVDIIREQQADAGVLTVSLLLFNGDVRTAYAYAPVQALTHLSASTYRPNGSTALYDAIGAAIDLVLRAEGFDEANTAFFVNILTDGEENTSKDCFGALIRACIGLLEGTKRVTFAFMGPKEGLATIGDVLAVAPGNLAGFDASSVAGRTQAFAAMSIGTSTYLRERSIGATAVTDVYGRQPPTA